MLTTRREFMQMSLATGAVLAMPLAFGAGTGRAPLRILILGGTGFLGPAIVEEAQKRGHSLTLFNRGKREKTKGTSFEGVEKLLGNRDPKKYAEDGDATTPLGLSQIEAEIKDGKRWDAVIDTSGYYTRMVRSSAQLLAPAADQYVFISTVSVYAGNAKPNEDETAPVGVIPDADAETMGADMSNYGPLKALCEQEAEKAFPGKATCLRAGFIVGVRDDSDRFTYWPVRASRGGEMLAPGDPNDSVQFIDVRDLAAFTLHCIETKAMGVMNVTGPVRPEAWSDVLKACADASEQTGHPRPTLTWVPTTFLEQQHSEIGGDFPIWLPPEGEYAGFHTRSIAKAVKAGLKTRPTIETCKEILAWWPGEIERRKRVTAEMTEAAEKAGKPAPHMADPEKLRVGITPEHEAELLKAWHEHKPQ